MVKSISHLTYSERLKEICLPTLEFRRTRADIIEVYKILNKIDIVYPNMLIKLDETITIGT